MMARELPDLVFNLLVGRVIEYSANISLNQIILEPPHQDLVSLSSSKYLHGLNQRIRWEQLNRLMRSEEREPVNEIHVSASEALPT
jgi:hypothetical protein